MRLRIFLFFVLPLAGTAASGVDTSAMNPAVDPCVDFYQNACGNWVAKNPLPAGRSRWARFTELSERTQQVLLDLVQGAAAPKPGRSSLEQKIGDYFASCMDTVAIARKGIAPVKAELVRIRAMRKLDDLAAEMARLHSMGVGGLFSFGSRPYAKDSNLTIASVNQAGLSLPDREYYLKTDAKSVETRQRFAAPTQNMFRSPGDAAETAAAESRSVLGVETRLAEGSLDRVSLRIPEKNYHILSRKELGELAPSFGWEAYFKNVGAPAFATLNVGQPDYLKHLAAVIESQTLENWKAYLG